MKLQSASHRWSWPTCSWNSTTRFYLQFVIIPVAGCIIYAIAILFPPGARAKVPMLLYTKGALTQTEDGVPILCPRAAICSEGILQIVLVGISRLTAFASYVFTAHTFLSKMHCTIHALSTTYLGTLIPFPRLHNVHKVTGRWYGGLILVHTIAHIIRWIIRRDMSFLIDTHVGISGLVGVVCIVMIITIMSPWARKKDLLTFERRITAHWIFTLCLVLAMAFHSPRCRIITFVFSGLWLLDNLYGKFFKTYRLDIVEFSPLPGRAGVQMLWRNPPGFNANSGEYVKVQIPWLSRGGSEWHPFSVYLKEQTAEGLGEVLRDQSSHQSDYNLHSQRVHFGGVLSGRSVNPSTTALLLVEYQNEFASKNGKLHEGVKKVMESTNMLQNTVNLVEYARTVGTHIFHLPIAFDADGIDNPNKNLGILKDCHRNLLFTKGTWNAEIVDCLKPKIGDIIIQNKKGLDCFMGTDLQELLQKKGIETIIIGGFLTNGCVESTMRTGYEKGYNVITLEDGSACNSHTEQVASTQFSWKMFSTPMKCAEAIEVLGGNTPRRLQDEDSSNYATASSSEDDEEIGLRFVSKARKNDAGDMDLRSFITHHHRSIMTSVHQSVNSTSHGSPVLVDVKHFIMDEAREEARSQYKTTQIFMIPAGDWTKEVYDEVYHQRQLRHCWVRGPFVSPYSIVSNFSHLVLVASGIGITPALGVMGQYKGNSRTKVLVWSTRCPTMLKFFAPLLEDAAMAIIYYTGKTKLSPREIERLTHGKKIFIQQSRPDDITSTVDTIITTIASGEMFEDNALMEIPKKMREQWCILYCGGSQKICDMISDYSQRVDIQFHHEKFDW